MQIETYEIEEVKGDGPNMIADHEAIELCEKLGLKGQLNVSDKETVTRFPYPMMSKVQLRVFETLLPEKTPVEDYSIGIIPLRVLQVLAFCKESNMFHKYHVWHPAEVRKDPVLTGQTKDDDYTSRYFLLARWGDALLPFEELQAKAIPMLTAKVKRELLSIQNEVSGLLSNVEHVAA